MSVIMLGSLIICWLGLSFWLFCENTPVVLSQKKCRLCRNPTDCTYPALFRTRSARITACASRSAGRSTFASPRNSFATL